MANIDKSTRRKWDAASRTYDFFSYAENRRLGPHKRRLFARARGRTLLVAAGTGRDFGFLPAGMDVVAIDISPKMLERAAKKVASYPGTIHLLEMDVCALDFPDETFDTVLTVLTFCSVPRPIAGIRELRRVLKPDGRLLMLEHVRSGFGPFAIMMDLMSPITSRVGPALNRNTVDNVQRAGFHPIRVENLYLDVLKSIEAKKAVPEATPASQ